MSKHTPGPWRVISSREDELKVKGPTDEWVADCADGFWSDETDDWIMAAESVANARLIAEAPAMLAALKDCRTHIANARGTQSEMLRSRVDAILSRLTPTLMGERGE